MSNSSKWSFISSNYSKWKPHSVTGTTVLNLFLFIKYRKTNHLSNYWEKNGPKLLQTILYSLAIAWIESSALHERQHALGCLTHLKTTGQRKAFKPHSWPILSETLAWKRLMVRQWIRSLDIWRGWPSPVGVPCCKDQSPIVLIAFKFGTAEWKCVLQLCLYFSSKFK